MWTAEVDLRGKGTTVAVTQVNGTGEILFPTLRIIDPAFVVNAGSIYTTGFKIVDGQVLIGVYASGTGSGVAFTMSGALTSSEEIPRQPPMRLHGVVTA